MKKRVLFYSHDTFGLGHIRRTQKIANELAGPDTAILIICSSPKAADYRSQDGIEYLNLPGFTKLKTGKYTPRNLNLDLESFVKIRSNIILSAVRSFEPHVFVVDKEPLGVKAELLPSLEYLSKERPQTQTVCGIRDILDDPEKIAIEWKKRGSKEALLNFYKSILVYGDQSIYDLQKQYSLGPELGKRLKYVGYITQKESDNLQIETIPLTNTENRPLVTFSLGGGEDGDEFLNTFLSMLKKYDKNIPFHSLVVTGPFLSNGRYLRAQSFVDQLNNVDIFNFVPNMFEVLKQSDGLVTMGGYNTFCECLSLKKVPIILPRVEPREEQLIRAKIFKDIGLCDYIHPDDLNEEILLERILMNLEANKQMQNRPHWEGLKQTALFLDGLAKKSVELLSPRVNASI